MSTAVSVVVVSRGRPAALMRCLNGLAQLDYAPFELVVVACPAGADAVRARTDAGAIKLIGFDEANISAARNHGIAAAAGELVAFIDDDAVPEPLWLRHLAAPFGDAAVAAAGGYVLGRNGISFQWRARSVDRTGQAHALDYEADAPTVLQGGPDRAIKTEGTNMALRRDVLAEMGGFDPAFRYYMDETDLNMRLAREGHATALVPMAQVHHGFAESRQRAADRSPRDLFEIAASQMVYLRKHCPEDLRERAWRDFRDDQRRRALRFMQRGPLGADDVARLMRRLRLGRRDGADRPLVPLPRIARAPDGFLPYPGRPGARRVVLAGRTRQAARLRREAARHVAQGDIVTLFLLSPTALYHHVRFTGDGVWEQTGGVFGRSMRQAPLVQMTRFDSRVAQEVSRVVPMRGGLAE